MKYFSLFLLTFSLFLFACGGGSSSSLNTNTVTDTTLAADAVSSSPWSAEAIVPTTTAQKTEANSNIRELMISVIASAEQDIVKKSKTTTTSYDKTIAGPNGGTATATGAVDVTTEEIVIYPMVRESDVTITFDGYLDTEFSLHGESKATSSTTVSSPGNFVSTISSHGGYSYKDSNGVYSFATQMNFTLTSVNSVYSGTFTFVVNGETITGTF